MDFGGSLDSGRSFHGLDESAVTEEREFFSEDNENASMMNANCADESKAALNPLDESKSRPQRQISLNSRNSPSCRLLPIWQRIFRLRRSAERRKSKKYNVREDGDQDLETPALLDASSNSSWGVLKTRRGAPFPSMQRQRSSGASSNVANGGRGVVVAKGNPELVSSSSVGDGVGAARDSVLEEKRAMNSSAVTNSFGVASSLDPAGLDTRVPMAENETSPNPTPEKMECPLCLSRKPSDQFPHISTCSHRSCLVCIKHYLTIEISEARTNICCPECVELFHPTDIERILQDDQLMAKFGEFTLRRHLANEPDCRWCPAPDCGYAVIATGCASCPRIQCQREGCNIYFCYHCKQEWHPETTCDEARNLRRRSPGMSVMLGTISENRRPLGMRRRNWGNDPGPLYRSMFPLEGAPSVSSKTSLAGNDIKQCPRCGASIIKMEDGSCNHITCAVCGAEFCWLCMREISDLHYLSPSGCTFWGKKPWSRKKKILWQLGTLVGAPVGIGLVAGIAVPAIVIGVPVWVGRKIYARYENLPRYKRNLHIFGSVSASVLVSPVLAAVAVGVGVPILLAYVYGVVPISLCRAGGCGVSTSSSGGVRFDFDDDVERDDSLNANTAPPIPDNQSADVSHVGTIGNPSIGDDSAVLLPGNQGDDDSQVAGLLLGGSSVGEAATSRVGGDHAHLHLLSHGVGGGASRHGEAHVGESASTTGVLSAMTTRSGGAAGASFVGLSALGDSASYADSILADTMSASSVPAAASAGQSGGAYQGNRLEVLADVSAVSGAAGGASTATLAGASLKGATGGAMGGVGSGGKRASVSSSAGSTSFNFACDSKSATVSFQSDGEAASTRALAGSILSRNERDRDSGLGTPQPGQMEVQADILTNPSISSYRFGNGSITSFSNNNSRRGSLGSGLAPDEPRGVNEGLPDEALLARRNVSTLASEDAVYGGGHGAMAASPRPGTRASGNDGAFFAAADDASLSSKDAVAPAAAGAAVEESAAAGGGGDATREWTTERREDMVVEMVECRPVTASRPIPRTRLTPSSPGAVSRASSKSPSASCASVDFDVKTEEGGAFGRSVSFQVDVPGEGDAKSE